MDTKIVAVPVGPNGQVGAGWGKAASIALAGLTDGVVTSWDVHDVRWDISHETDHGRHHATIARFLREHGVEVAVAGHMGPPMQNMLTKLGIRVELGAAGDARAAVTGLAG